MKFLLCILLLTPSLNAAEPTSESLLTQLKSCMASGASVKSVVDELKETPSAELKKFITSLEKAWPIVKNQYVSELERTAKSLSRGSQRNKNQARIRALRSQFMEVYQLDEDAMKPLLKSKSMPAMEELRILMLPSSDVVIKAGGEPLAKLRHHAISVATVRDAALNADYSTIPVDAMEQLNQAEKRAAETVSVLDNNGLKMLENNAKVAAKEKVPAEEVKGIEQYNLWRLLLGMNACSIDARLCDTSRDHSKDMEEKGFFAHESPVPGKKTPWDRAAKFKTSSSGENIYMGPTSPNSANEAWFYSPGHHKNMFNPKHTRVGLGQHGKHWTQMFGQ